MANGQKFLIILPDGSTSERPVEGLVWKDSTDTVPGSSSKVIDSFLASEFYSSSYKITLYNTTQNKSLSFNVEINHDSTDTYDQVYGKNGTRLNIRINTRISSGSVELEIVNNEIYDLDVGIMKLPQPQTS